MSHVMVGLKCAVGTQLKLFMAVNSAMETMNKCVLAILKNVLVRQMHAYLRILLINDPLLSFYSDPCNPNPCFDGVSCTILSDTEYKCGSCPLGMKGNGVQCTLINEVRECIIVLAFIN